MDTKSMILIYCLLVFMLGVGSCEYHVSDDFTNGLLARVKDVLKRSLIQKRAQDTRDAILSHVVRVRKKRTACNNNAWFGGCSYTKSLG